MWELADQIVRAEDRTGLQASKSKNTKYFLRQIFFSTKTSSIAPTTTTKVPITHEITTKKKNEHIKYKKNFFF